MQASGFIEIKRNLRKKIIQRANQSFKFIRSSITNGIYGKHRPNLEEKTNPSNLRGFFYQRQTHSFLHQKHQGW